MLFALCKYDTNSEKLLLPLNQGNLSRLVINLTELQQWKSGTVELEHSWDCS